MTQSLRRERRQKFTKILHTWIKDTPAITGVISDVLILDEEITALAVMLADAATSATERRIEEEFGDQKPNIFKTYEDNIGALSPMLADELKEIEKDYPSGWFEDAVKEALGKNVRNLKYIKAILARWKVEGRGEKKAVTVSLEDSGWK
jgi:DnaD/phage-associated family protein